MNAGLILAGGKGERISGYDTPKQFVEIGGKPVVAYCLETFEACADIDVICVAADRNMRARVGDCLFADAGASRQHSIYNGLLALRAHAPSRVVIHDAARPLVTVSDISGLIRAAAGFDGATPSLPVTETIYRSYNGKSIATTLDRDELFVGQTPECYAFFPYLEAHEKYADRLESFRGSSEIAVNAGMKIALAEGNPENFKITTNADLERFRHIVSGGFR